MDGGGSWGVGRGRGSLGLGKGWGLLWGHADPYGMTNKKGQSKGNREARAKARFFFGGGVQGAKAPC